MRHEIKEQFQNSKSQRLQERITQLDEKLKRISQETDENDSNLVKVKNMIQELQENSDASMEELIQKINTVNRLIKELENPIADETETETTEEKSDENQNSLSDTKTERIKLKIQKLETEMNRLAEQVKGNPASERWLNNAFSLIEDAKSQVDESPESALSTIKKVELIIDRIKNTIQ